MIGLLEEKIDVAPTTAYLMTYTSSKCRANCGFCPQARESNSNLELLSRVTWPIFPIESVMKSLVSAVNEHKIGRVCIQALNYSEVFSHLESLVHTLKKSVDVPVSVSCQPLNSLNLRLLSQAGVDRIGIPLDAATKKIFDKVKGAVVGGLYRWRNELSLLSKATEVFGAGNVSTHLIVGLGETEREAVCFLQQCTDMGVLPALFAFTPVDGTMLSSGKQPSMTVYRRIQLARHIIVLGLARIEAMKFDPEERIVDLGVSKQGVT